MKFLKNTKLLLLIGWCAVFLIVNGLWVAQYLRIRDAEWIYMTIDDLSIEVRHNKNSTSNVYFVHLRNDPHKYKIEIVETLYKALKDEKYLKVKWDPVQDMVWLSMRDAMNGWVTTAGGIIILGLLVWGMIGLGNRESDPGYDLWYRTEKAYGRLMR